MKKRSGGFFLSGVRQAFIDFSWDLVENLFWVAPCLRIFAAQFNRKCIIELNN